MLPARAIPASFHKHLIKRIGSLSTDSVSKFSATNTPADIADLPEKAVKLAAELLRASREHETSTERENSAKMARMMADESGKKFTIAMADQVLRMHKPRRSAGRLSSLLKEYGLPKYFGFLDRTMLWGCLLYTSPSPRDRTRSRMPSSA